MSVTVILLVVLTFKSGYVCLFFKPGGVQLFFWGGVVLFFLFLLLKDDVFYSHLVMNMAKRRIYLNKLCMGKRGHF